MTQEQIDILKQFSPEQLQALSKTLELRMLVQWAETMILGIVAILVILFVVRPLIKKAFEPIDFEPIIFSEPKEEMPLARELEIENINKYVWSLKSLSDRYKELLSDRLLSKSFKSWEYYDTFKVTENGMVDIVTGKDIEEAYMEGCKAREQFGIDCLKSAVWGDLNILGETLYGPYFDYLLGAPDVILTAFTLGVTGGEPPFN